MFFSVFAIWTRSHCFELIASTEPTRGVFLFGGVLSSQNILYQNILDTAVTLLRWFPQSRGGKQIQSPTP